MQEYNKFPLCMNVRLKIIYMHITYAIFFRPKPIVPLCLNILNWYQIFSGCALDHEILDLSLSGSRFKLSVLRTETVKTDAPCFKEPSLLTFKKTLS